MIARPLRRPGLSAVQSVLLVGTGLFVVTGVRQAWQAAREPFAERAGQAIRGEAELTDSTHAANPNADGSDADDPPAARTKGQAAADTTWPRNAADAAANLANDPDLVAELTTALGTSTTLSLTELKRVLAIESLADRATGTNEAGATGLFQMTPIAALDVGVTDFSTLDDPAEWKANVAAGVKLMEKNAARLKSKGYEVTPLNLYLSHQLGSLGARQLLDALKAGTATGPATRDQLKNLPPAFKKQFDKDHPLTMQDYYDYMSTAYSHVQGAIP